MTKNLICAISPHNLISANIQNKDEEFYLNNSVQLEIKKGNTVSRTE